MKKNLQPVIVSQNHENELPLYIKALNQIANLYVLKILKYYVY